MKQAEFYPLTKQQIIEKIEELAKNYTPEWHFNKENPDIGSVIALLYADLLKQDVDVLNGSRLKHKIGFLNCLETNLKVAVPAQGYITFEHIPGLKDGEFIPKGTKIAARSSDGEDISFTTMHGVYATDKKPTELIFCIGDQDRITEVDLQQTELKNLNIKLFDEKEENLQSHNLYIAHPYLLKDTKKGKLKISFNLEESKALSFLADPEEVEWQLLSKEGFEEVLVKKEGTDLVFEIDNIPQEPCTYKGISSYWLKAHLKEGMKVPLCVTHEILMRMNGQAVVPDTVYAQDIECDKAAFEPFGNPLQIYAESYIRCDEAFAKIGAHIELHFDLSYKTKENDLQVPPQEVHYRYIMRKPKEPKKLDPFHIKSDEVIWEYWNGRGWEKLFKNAEYDTLFNGQKEGRMKVSFVCPDIKEVTVNAFEAKWIRIRLVRADNLYSLPNVEHIPQIKNLTIDYGYPEGGLHPQRVICENNLDEFDATKYVNNKKSIRLFNGPLFKHPSWLIGFDELPQGSPIGLFFDIMNNNKVDHPSFSFAYSTYKNERPIFKKTKVLDGTKGLMESGNMMFMLPKEFKKFKLFSKEKYWLLLENYSDEYNKTKTPKPLIKGMYMNTARMINRKEEERYEYITQKTGTVRCKLGRKNVIDVEVYINEKPALEEEKEKLLKDSRYEAEEKKDFKGETTEFWVKWQRCETETELYEGGRKFYVDYFLNEIIFPENIFTQIPINDEYQSIKIRYAICNGSRGNMSASAVNMLERPIGYIGNVYNPTASFGGGDFESVVSAAQRTSKFLTNRERAVTLTDYEQMVQTYSPTIRKVKCIPHVNEGGESENMSMTIVILEEDYAQGSSIINTYKDDLKAELLEKSELSLLARDIYIRAPEYIRLSATIWIRSESAEKAYEYQNDIIMAVEKFLDPITGGFEGEGWEIGRLPEKSQLEAYLKSLRMDCSWQKLVLTARIITPNEVIEKDIEDIKERYFALPISGKHEVIVEDSF